MAYDWQTHFLEVRWPSGQDNFLKVKETLTRIGAPGLPKIEGDKKILWQSCHILYKRQRYYLVHYKQMFALDGREAQTVISENDLARRNTIALLLEEWKLLEIVTPLQVEVPVPAPVDTIKIVPYREKGNWSLQAKYEIGKHA